MIYHIHISNQGRYDDDIGIFSEFIDSYNVLMLPTTGRYFQIPLRSVIPLKIDNLLVAAAVSHIKNIIVRDVDCMDVQRELLKQNVKLNLNSSKL